MNVFYLEPALKNKTKKHDLVCCSVLGGDMKPTAGRYPTFCITLCTSLPTGIMTGTWQVVKWENRKMEKQFKKRLLYKLLLN